jgi:hypothetical protein
MSDRTRKDVEDYLLRNKVELKPGVYDLFFKKYGSKFIRAIVIELAEEAEDSLPLNPETDRREVDMKYAQNFINK